LIVFQTSQEFQALAFDFRASRLISFDFFSKRGPRSRTWPVHELDSINSVHGFPRASVGKNLEFGSGTFAWLTNMCERMCGGSHMATNLAIDPELIERALEVSGERTKKAAVTKALQEFIARRRQKRLLDLMGKLEWDTSYDYKKERSR
jgi:Arc/MetJ family transcription regulator